MNHKNNKIYFLYRNVLLFLFIVKTSSVIPQYSNTEYNKSSVPKEKYSFPEKTKFEKVSSENEFITGTKINCMIQDKDGFIWYSAKQGLIRYDGYTSKMFFGSNSSVRGEEINWICYDEDGILWLSPYNEYIIKFDIKSEEFKYIFLNNDSTVPKCTSVWYIINYGKENLIIATVGGGMKIYNKKSGTIKHFYKSDVTVNCILSDNILSLMLDRKGLIYIGTEDNGLSIYDSSDQSFTNFQHNKEDSMSLSNNNIVQIYEDIKNNIWIGTEDGLNLFDKQNNNFTVYKNDPDDPNSISGNQIQSICEDKNNDLWFGTYYGGLNKLEEDKSFTTFRSNYDGSSTLPGDFVLTVFTDMSNVLWIGTRGDGLFKLDLERKKFHTLSNFNLFSKSPSTNSVSLTFIDSYDIVWVCAEFNAGFYKFKKDETGQLVFKEYRLVSEFLEYFEDRNNKIWFVNYKGEIFEYDREKNSFKSIGNKLSNLWNGVSYKVDNNIYFGLNNDSFLKFDIEKKEFSNSNIKAKRIIGFPKYLFESPLSENKNNIWFKTGNGMFCKYEIDKNQITEFDDGVESMDSSWGVRSFYEDEGGNLWLGSDKKLVGFDKSNGNFKINSSVKANIIIEDNNGFLWTGYIDGLYKFDPEKNTVQHFDQSDGLQGNEFESGKTVFKDKDGILYFGGRSGITYFNPSEIKNNPYIPNIAVTDIRVLNQSVNPSLENLFLKELDLSYKENVFSFEFAALIYNNPSKNQYAYQMEGFDKDWIYCGSRRNVTYTNLDPGDYTFRVKGSNNDGIWNEEGTSVKVTITPPWWQTWWFKSCGAVMISLTAGYGYKKRVNKLKKEKSAQEEFSKKLLNSQEEERKKIASVLHDSIAHDVLITKNSSEIGLRSAGENEEVKEILNKISEQSSSTLNELRRIQFNLHPYEVEKLGLTKAIKSIVDRVSKSIEIKFTFEEDFIDKVFSEENEIHLYRIIQEAVNNIIKHSSATEARIKINRNDENVSITISDNGKGFSKNYALRKNSMGLSGMSERVKLLGGNLEIESAGGTVLRISLPVSDLRF